MDTGLAGGASAGGNAAAGGAVGPFDEPEYYRVVAVNLRGNFHVLAAAGRVMTADRKSVV